MSLAHLLLHWSNFLAFLFFKLVTGPMPLNSSPTPPVYAWSVSQDFADQTFRPLFGSRTFGSENTATLVNSSIGLMTNCQ